MTITLFSKTPPPYGILGPMKGGNYKATGVEYNSLVPRYGIYICNLK